MSPSYRVPATTLERALAVKKSRFIARATRVESREQAMAFLETLRRDHPDARHHCWAYLLGNPQSASTAACHDDGEPSGTAGKPILHVIQHKGIGDVMVVVARYFGGIKLGAGGLTRAYRAACEEVLTALPLALRQPLLQRRVRCDFSLEQPLRHWAAQHGVRISAVAYVEQVMMELEFPSEALSALEAYCRSQTITLLV